MIDLYNSYSLSVEKIAMHRSISTNADTRGMDYELLVTPNPTARAENLASAKLSLKFKSFKTRYPVKFQIQLHQEAQCLQLREVFESELILENCLLGYDLNVTVIRGFAPLMSLLISAVLMSTTKD